MKIVKLSLEGILAVMSGVYSSVHVNAGYLLVADEDVTYDENGDLFPYYRLEEGQYVYAPELDAAAAKEQKYSEIWVEANARNVAAETQFSAASNSTPRANDRNQKTWSRISNKKARGQSLNAKEQKFDDDYDSMLDYQDAVNDAADLAEDEIETMSDPAMIRAYDVVAGPSWPAVWTKPV